MGNHFGSVSSLIKINPISNCSQLLFNPPANEDESHVEYADDVDEVADGEEVADDDFTW